MPGRRGPGAVVGVVGAVVVGLALGGCSSPEAPVRRLHEETFLADVDVPDRRVRESFRVSLDGRRIGYIAPAGGGRGAWVDGREHGRFDDVRRIVFSPDGGRVGLEARAGEEWLAVVDGTVVGRHPMVTGLGFSPDGRRTAYVARADDQWAVIVDGEPGRRYDAVSPWVRFSSDGARVAHWARSGDEWLAVVDGEEVGRYPVAPPPFELRSADAFSLVPPDFSPDGRRVAYVAQAGDRAFVVVDGVRGKAYDDIELVPPPWTLFGPAGRRVVYRARAGGASFVVVDGEEGVRHDGVGELAFAPDGERMAYVARSGGQAFVVAGGTPETPYEVAGTTTAAGEFAPALRSPLGLPITGLAFSPDSARIAYRADGRPRPPGVRQRLTLWLAGNRPAARSEWVVVVDGRAGPRYPDPQRRYAFAPIRFTADGAQVVHVAHDAAGEFVVVGGHAGRRYDVIVNGYVAVDDRIRYFAVSGSRLLRVEETLGR